MSYTVTVERAQGVLTLSTVAGGHLIRRRYIGYTVREARVMFAAYVLEMAR